MFVFKDNHIGNDFPLSRSDTQKPTYFLMLSENTKISFFAFSQYGVVENRLNIAFNAFIIDHARKVVLFPWNPDHKIGQTIIILGKCT